MNLPIRQKLYRCKLKAFNAEADLAVLAKDLDEARKMIEQQKGVNLENPMYLEAFNRLSKLHEVIEILIVFEARYYMKV